MNKSNRPHTHGSTPTLRPNQLPPSTPANAVIATAERVIGATAAGIGALASGRGERWRPMDHVRYLFLLTAAINVWALRVLMDLFSCYSPPYFSSGSMEPCAYGRVGGDEVSSALVGVGGEDGRWPCYYHAAAIGKTLSHILEILNETAASSRKYEFIISMADQVLADNLHSNHPGLSEITRAALTSAFSRTCVLLRCSLETSPSSFSGPATWPTRLLHLLPLGPRLAAAIRSFLSSPSQPSARSGASSFLEAEKLANEVLWIAGKMRSCGAAVEAVARWAESADLAALTMTAHPRVQGAVVRMTVMMLREMRGEEEEEIKYRMLMVWIPVLCCAGNGVAGPVLTGAERWEVERVVEGLMAGLPLEHQEVIFLNWLEDFVVSNSDWPNLQVAFDRWCRHCRKVISCNLGDIFD